MSRCKFGWINGCAILPTLGMAGNSALLSAWILYIFASVFTRMQEWGLQAWPIETVTKGNNGNEEKLTQTRGFAHISFNAEAWRHENTLHSLLPLSVCSWFVIFPECCCIKAFTQKRAWHDMPGTRLCSGMRLWSWRFFSCVQCTKVQPQYNPAEGKNSGGEFCPVTEELVQVSNKCCMHSFPSLMRF